MYQFDHPQTIAITVLSTEQLRAVYAVLADPANMPEVRDFDSYGSGCVVAERGFDSYGSGCAVAEQATETPEHRHEPADYEQDDEPADAVEVDSAGVPFDAERHTGTKLKSGLWRMKKGFERPEDDASSNGSTSTASTGETESSQSEDAPTEDAGPATDEDDEFAAFKQAAAESEAATPVSPAVREWSDADLGSLLNQAALKLGGPDKIREKIAEFTPEGVVAHSRNIPADRREEFAQQIEKLADIEFAG